MIPYKPKKCKVPRSIVPNYSRYSPSRAKDIANRINLLQKVAAMHEREGDKEAAHRVRRIVSELTGVSIRLDIDWARRQLSTALAG